MKTIKPLLLTALLATFALIPAFADKGAERLAAGNVITDAGKPTPMMQCPTELRKTTDMTARGAFKPVTVYTAHKCGSCDTKQVVTGVGKGAMHATVHSCEQANTCCKTKL